MRPVSHNKADSQDGHLPNQQLAHVLNTPAGGTYLSAGPRGNPSHTLRPKRFVSARVKKGGRHQP
jgi:hypothetical protein